MCRALANCGVAASTEAAGDRITNADAGGGVGFNERLCIGVHRNELNAEQLRADHAVHRIGARAADANNTDQRKVFSLRSHRPLPPLTAERRPLHRVSPAVATALPSACRSVAASSGI